MMGLRGRGTARSQFRNFGVQGGERRREEDTFIQEQGTEYQILER